MNRIFVYGSLMTGGHNHILLRSSPENRRVEAEIWTQDPEWILLDLGSFPALVRASELSGIRRPSGVVGETWDVDDRTLELLDRLEGHPHFYRRTAIDLEGGQRAQAYLLNVRARPGAMGLGTVPDGDWRPFLARLGRGGRYSASR